MGKIREDIEENIEAEQEGYDTGEDALSAELRAKIEWFRDQKIGVIFHWGLYAQAGIVESWQLSEEDEWAREPHSWRPSLDALRKDYWALNQTFKPSRFDARKWAETCKAAGFRYMIFTTKHHDGFSMYDTQFSDYKLSGGDSAFRDDPRADAFGEAAREFQAAGLAVGAYYSKADWHSPYYWVPGQHAKGRTASYDPQERPDLWTKFNQFVTDQLTELATNYGKLDLLWLDAGWVNGGNHEFLDMDTIAGKVRKKQPDLLIVDRTIGGKYENYVTPERKIPETAPVKAWESNIPLANNWGYVPGDSYKSFGQILESIVKIVCMGGNVILGVGPKPDGTLPEEAVTLMAALGDWLDRYGEAVYSTRPIHFEDLSNHFAFVQNGEIIYGFIKTEELTAALLTELSAQTETVTFLNSGQTVNLREAQTDLPTYNELYTVFKFKRA
ncbi:alpha-L-fucosidase [Lactovum odontotermitis]